MLLELLHAGGHVGLHAVQLRGRARDAALLRNGAEDVQRFKFERSHREIFSITIIHSREWARQATMRRMMDRYRHIALSGLAALAVAMGIGRFAFTPILPMMQQDAGLTLAQGGWLASANYVGYLAGGLTAVALRIGPARAIRLGLALVAV